MAWLGGAQAYIRQEPMSPLPFRLAVCLMTGRGQLGMAADAAQQVRKQHPLILPFRLCSPLCIGFGKTKIFIQQTNSLLNDFDCT